MHYTILVVMLQKFLIIHPFAWMYHQSIYSIRNLIDLNKGKAVIILQPQLLFEQPAGFPQPSANFLQALIP